MTRKFIMEGDTHSHGGRVLGDADHARLHGHSIARRGTRAVCAVHGDTWIAEVSGQLRIDGVEVAVAGDSLACGARLQARQAASGVA